MMDPFKNPVAYANAYVAYLADTSSQKDEVIKELLGALDGLVGETGYLRADVCECDNTHEQNGTVCRICWARLALDTYRDYTATWQYAYGSTAK